MKKQANLKDMEHDSMVLLTWLEDNY